MRFLRSIAAACLVSACGSLAAATAPTPSPAADCAAYPLPSRDVGAEIAHNKTSATVIEVTSPCTVRVRISGGNGGTLATFNDRVIVLRATTRTTYRTAADGDVAAIGRFGLKSGDGFTLSFDSRPFPDGSYPLNFMNW
jgi:hypothetical protein